MLLMLRDESFEIELSSESYKDKQGERLNLTSFQRFWHLNPLCLRSRQQTQFIQPLILSMSHIEVQCQKCSKQIPEHHFKIHSFQCTNYTLSPLIASLFMSRVLLLSELKSIESSGQQRIECRYCHQSLTQSQIPDHTFKCSKILMNCIYCNSKITTEESLQHYQSCVNTISQQEVNTKYGSYKENMNRSITVRFNPQKQSQIDTLIRTLKIQSRTRETQQKRHQVEGFDQTNYKQLPECSLCKSNLQNGQKVVKGTCGHVLHAECHTEWTIRTYQCPSCLSHGF